MNLPESDSNQAWSEQWRVRALEHADADNAAMILEESKSVVFSQMLSSVMIGNPSLAVNRAEIDVKSSKGWKRFIEDMVKARHVANQLRVERDYLRMKFQEWISSDANARAERRL
jgi:hypothetical protein